MWSISKRDFQILFKAIELSFHGSSPLWEEVGATVNDIPVNIKVHLASFFFLFPYVMQVARRKG